MTETRSRFKACLHLTPTIFLTIIHDNYDKKLLYRREQTQNAFVSSISM